MERFTRKLKSFHKRCLWHLESLPPATCIREMVAAPIISGADESTQNRIWNITVQKPETAVPGGCNKLSYTWRLMWIIQYLGTWHSSTVCTSSCTCTCNTDLGPASLHHGVPDGWHGAPNLPGHHLLLHLTHNPDRKILLTSESTEPIHSGV